MSAPSPARDADDARSPVAVTPEPTTTSRDADADADDDARARAMRKMLHDSCVDLDDHLSADERDEMQQLQARARAPGGERPLGEEDMRRLELLIHGATVRRIEQAVDEQLVRQQQGAGVVI